MSSPAAELPRWSLDPALCAALVLTAGAYLVAAGRAQRWPARRAWAFLGGLAALAIALQSGLHAAGEERLSLHMVQHLVLTLVVAPLLLAGAPISLALRAVPQAPRRALARRLRSRPAHLVVHPIAAWAVFAGVLVGTHAPAFYGAALTHAWLHDAEHLLYLGSALLLWAPLVAAEPVPHPPSPVVRVLLALAAMPVMTFVGIALMTVGSAAYPEYLEPASRLRISALADQHTAGTIMWLGGTLPMAIAVVALGWRAFMREEERAERREAHARSRRAPTAAGRAP